MSSLAAVLPVRGAPGPDTAPLHLFAACGLWVLALPSARVDRLLLPEEANWLDAELSRHAPAANLGVLVAGSRRYSAWDLGLLLGLGPQAGSWVLLSLPRPGHAGPEATEGLAVALRTGSCLSVGPLPPASPLPVALAAARRGLFAAAFPASGVARGRSALSPVALALDLERLFTDEEAAFATLSLGSGEGGPA